MRHGSVASGSEAGWAGSQHGGRSARGSPRLQQRAARGPPSITGTREHQQATLNDYDAHADSPPYLVTPVYAIAQAGLVPNKAQRLLREAEAHDAGLRVALDAEQGWVGVVAGDGMGCEVWDYRGRPDTAAIAYSFPATISKNRPDLSEPPFIYLIPSRSRRDPSLLLIAPSGGITFYESVTSALPQSHGQNVQIPRRGVVHDDLNVGEGQVKGVWRISSNKFLIAMSSREPSASTIRYTYKTLSLRQTSGHYHTLISSIAIPRSKSTGFLGGWNEEEAMMDLSVGPGRVVGERIMVVLMSRSVQVWTIKGDVDIFQYSHLLTSVIAEDLVAHFASSHSARDIRSSLKILAIRYLENVESGDGFRFIALCSYTTNAVRHYALAIVDSSADNLRVAVRFNIGFSENLPKLNSDEHRSLATIVGSNVAVVQLCEAAVLVSWQGSTMSHVTQLKDPQNFFLSATMTGTTTSVIAHLFTSKTALLKMDIDLGAMSASTDDESVRHANSSGKGHLRDDQLLVRIEQAIRYDTEENPIYLGLTTDFDSENGVQWAVPEVSKRVMSSPGLEHGDLDGVRSTLELKRTQLEALTEYVARNELLKDLSIEARHLVAMHRQTLEVALYGWWSHLEKHNRLLNLGDTSPTGLLATTIVSYMEESGDAADTGSNLIRSFFETRLASSDFLNASSTSLAAVLGLVHQRSTVAQAATDSEQGKAEWMAAEGQIFVITFQQGISESMARVYDGLEIDHIDLSAHSIHQFLTDDKTVDAALDLYRRISVAVVTPLGQDRDSSMAIDDDRGDFAKSHVVSRLERQLVLLARPLAFAVERNAVQRGGPQRVKGDQRAAAALLKQAEGTIAELLGALERVDPDLTRELAETHRNHPTLIRIADAEAVERYLDGFFSDGQSADTDAGEDFAQALFAMYENEDRIFDLLNRLPRHRTALAAYLNKRGHDQWSWINYLSMGNQGAASASLSAIGSKGNDTALALAKLASLCA